MVLAPRRWAAAAAAVALALAAAAGAGPASASAAAASARSAPVARAACATAAPMHVRCLSVVRVDKTVRADSALADTGAARPKGFGPADLASAYRLPAASASQTVAVVDAYDAPNAEKDLATYRATYGLPPCTTANGCFTKLNQAGRTSHYPPVDEGWAVEISLDLDMVSAACPSCHIVLVEARSDLVGTMAKAVDTAVAAGADVVSNSYGIDEFNGMAPYAKHYRPSGVAVLASSGDYGFGAAQFPAVAPGVTAVGGTSLHRAHNDRGWTEKAWAGAGSGCSAYVGKPTYQSDRHCHLRTVADVSSVADPDTGVAVYDSTPSPDGTKPGWLVIGGTSVSSPYVAGLVARAGNAGSFTTARLYARSSQLYDVVGGSNGFCGGDYLCTGKVGYDGPTGLGTPQGLGAF